MKKINIILAFSAIAFIALGFISNGQVIQNDIPIGLAVGNKAPDLNFNNPEGNPVKLSSLKGKLVLIDFWASWCGPCRFENPNIVNAYDKYKDQKFKSGKGFEIYSVSLDRNMGAWVNAIEKDNLHWKAHVSDLKYWYSEAAKLYKVSSIPTNYLLDGNGVILAKNLRGPALSSELEKYIQRK